MKGFALAKKKMKGGDTVASRLRALIIENPALTGGEIKALWHERGEKGNVTDQTVSTVRSYLKKLFFGDIPHHLGKFSKSSVIRQALKANPNWTDLEVADYLGQAGVLVERSLVSNARSVAKLGPPHKRKKRTAKIDNGSPDPNQNAGPRAGKGKLGRPKGSKGKGKAKAHREYGIDGYAAIERQLDDLVAAANAIGDSGLADAIRRSRRLASAQLID